LSEREIAKYEEADEEMKDLFEEMLETFHIKAVDDLSAIEKKLLMQSKRPYIIFEDNEKRQILSFLKGEETFIPDKDKIKVIRVRYTL